jgi:SAM-dependent methyltransferase
MTFVDDTRSRMIQLGCGSFPLPSPWENYDREVDITKTLPFPDGSVRFLFAEHVIEHISFEHARRFLTECHRVLEPGGVLRLAFPDVTRFVGDSEEVVSRRATYLDYLRTKRDRPTLGTLFRFLLHEHGHRSAWSGEIAFAALIAAGFDGVWPVLYGDSDTPELRGIERRHYTDPESACIAETTIIEATK